MLADRVCISEAWVVLDVASAPLRLSTVRSNACPAWPPLNKTCLGQLDNLGCEVVLKQRLLSEQA